MIFLACKKVYQIAYREKIKKRATTAPPPKKKTKQQLWPNSICVITNVTIILNFQNMKGLTTCLSIIELLCLICIDRKSN